MNPKHGICVLTLGALLAGFSASAEAEDPTLLALVDEAVAIESKTPQEFSDLLRRTKLYAELAPHRVDAVQLLLGYVRQAGNAPRQIGAMRAVSAVLDGQIGGILADAFQDADPAVRTAAVETLAASSTEEKPYILGDFYRSEKDPKVRLAAMKATAETSPILESYKFLAEAEKDPDPAIVRAAKELKSNPSRLGSRFTKPQYDRRK
jgi:hypothetical protein